MLMLILMLMLMLMLMLKIRLFLYKPMLISKKIMIRRTLIAFGISAVVAGLAWSTDANAVISEPSDTVKGRAPTATDLKIQNNTAPGLNPAQGDALEGVFTFNDPDGDQMDFPGVIWHQSEGGTIPDSDEGVIFVPGSAQLDSTLQFSAHPGTDINITDPSRAAEMMLSAPTAAPVLPSRAEFNSLYHFSSGANMRWGDAYMYCANRNERLMSVAELQELFVNYTRATTAPATENNRDLNETYGVGLSNVAWSTQGGDTRHSYVYIQTDGHESSNLNEGTNEVVCAKFGTPELLPQVTNVSFPNPVAGIEITAAYTYQGNATIPDRSRFTWKRANDTIGTGGVVVATTRTYTPVADDVGKYLVLTIYPASYDTVTGNNVQPAGKVVIAQEQSFPAGTTLEANGYDFAIDSGFPTLAFLGAKYQIQVGGNATGYAWSSDKSWINVDSNGNVTFTAKPTAKEFTVTATANGVSFKKQFLVQNWFTGDSTFRMYESAVSYCLTRGQLPSVDELTDGDYVRGQLGSLYSEWGNLTPYEEKELYEFWHWTRTASSPHPWQVTSATGAKQNILTNSQGYPGLCIQPI